MGIYGRKEQSNLDKKYDLLLNDFDIVRVIVMVYIYKSQSFMNKRSVVKLISYPSRIPATGWTNPLNYYYRTPTTYHLISFCRAFSSFN